MGQLGTIYTKMKYLILFLFLISFTSAITLDNNLVLNTTLSNSSITFSSDFNVTNLTIDPSYILLSNLSFTNLTGFYDCGDINHSDENTILDSSEFVCNLTEEIILAVEEDTPVEGSSNSGITFYPTQKELEKGYTKNIRKGLRVKVLVGEEVHYVDIKEAVDEKKVLISVSSEVQEKWLEKGEEWFVEVTGDNIYDIYVKVNSIWGLYTNITIKKIEKEIGSVVDEGVEVLEEPKQEVKRTFPKIVFGFLILVILICLMVLISFLKKPKWERRLMRNLFSMKHGRKKR